MVNFPEVDGEEDLAVAAPRAGEAAPRDKGASCFWRAPELVGNLSVGELFGRLRATGLRRLRRRHL